MFRISPKSALAAATILSAAVPHIAAAQDSFTRDMLIGGDDPTFPRNANRHYEILEITVTDPGAVGVTVAGTTHNGWHRFVVVPQGYVLPDANRPGNVRQIANEADAVAWQQIRRNGSNTLRDGPSADPLAEGPYQLFVGVNTANDVSFALTVLGARLGWGPTIEEEMAFLAAGGAATGLATVDAAHGIARSRGQLSLATRDAALSFARTVAPDTGGLQVSQSTMGAEGLAGNVYAWVDLNGFHAENDVANRSHTGRGLQIGADIAFGPDMVAGLSLGVQDMSSRIGTVEQDGILRFAQPYIAYASGPWSGEATVVLGHGDYTQTSAGGTGTGDVRLFAATFTGGYDFALDDGLTVTPTVGLTHGIERIEGRTGTLAGAGTRDVRFTQASLGAEFRYAMNGTEVTAGLHADWRDTRSDAALLSDFLVDDGVTGRLELGITSRLGPRTMFDTSLSLSGLGGDTRQVGGTLRFAIRF